LNIKKKIWFLFVNLEFKNEIFLFKDEVNSSQRNHASSWLRKVAVSMHFGIDTYALSVDLLDRFLATLKVNFDKKNISFKKNNILLRFVQNFLNVWVLVVYI
jgi:NADH:ubiquinone oxidoreductase subunit 4 (subunit M)